MPSAYKALNDASRVAHEILTGESYQGRTLKPVRPRNDTAIGLAIAWARRRDSRAWAWATEQGEGSPLRRDVTGVCVQHGYQAAVTEAVKAWVRVSPEKAAEIAALLKALAEKLSNLREPFAPENKLRVR